MLMIRWLGLSKFRAIPQFFGFKIQNYWALGISFLGFQVVLYSSTLSEALLQVIVNRKSR